MFGGERGIRTQGHSLDSVSYRFYVATFAVNANVAVAPCTLLHARLRFHFALICNSNARSRSSPFEQGCAARLCGSGRRASAAT
jgi:hypothetical protein